MSPSPYTTSNALRKSAPDLERQRLVIVAVGALGISCVIMTQLALMRELLGAFSGNEMVLGVSLGLWLLLMGLGTRLGLPPRLEPHRAEIEAALPPLR